MKRLKQTIAATIIAIIALTLLLLADDDGPVVARQAPDWSVQTLSGKTVGKNSGKGKVVILEFWSTSCQPCVASIPQENEFIKSLNHKAEVIGITADPPSVVRKFLHSHPMSANIGLDPSGKTSGSFRVEALPTAIIIDRFGNMVYKQTPPDYNVLRQVVAQYL